MAAGEAVSQRLGPGDLVTLSDHGAKMVAAADPLAKQTMLIVFLENSGGTLIRAHVIIGENKLDWFPLTWLARVP